MAGIATAKEGAQTLKRREKRRYVIVMHTGPDALVAVQKRHAELFGSVASQKADLRLIKNESGIAILRTSLAQTDNVLVTIALCDPPMATLDMSSSVKRLRRRL